MIAARQGQLDVVKLLLDNRVKVNLPPANEPFGGTTPLFIAARHGQLDVVQLLLDNGAEVNLAPASGVLKGATPLFIAAQTGQLDVAQLLIERGAVVNQANTNGVAPLFIAAQQGHLDVANLIKKQITKQILPKINRESVCCISNEVISEDGTIDSEIAYSTGGQHLYKKTQIEEWLRRGEGQALDPITRKPFRVEDLIDLTDEIKQHFKAIKIQALVRGRQGRDTVRALTQERRLPVEDLQPDYPAELITKLNVLLESNLPDNITKNGDGTYTYHYDAGNGAAELAEKPLHELTESELTELNHQIETRLARQQTAQEAGGQAEASTAASPQDLSHVARLAEQRAREEAREPQPNGR